MRDSEMRSRSRVEPRFGDVITPDESRSATADAGYRDILMDEPARIARKPRVSDDALTRPVERGVRPERAMRRVKGGGRISPVAEARNTSGFNLSFDWLRPAHFAVLIVMGLLVSLYWAAEPIGQFLERPFKSVVVEGDFEHVTKQRATQLIGEEIDSNFLKLDLMRIKSVLVADPWVDSVMLQRRWPDTLVVKIIEQKPIARWGDGFLNQRGEIVRVEDASVLSRLPWLQGSESNAVEILQQYLAISQALRTRGLDVIALKCDDKKAWRLTLNNNVEVSLGRGELMQKIQRLIDVYDGQLSSIWSDIVSIDARYSNGVAVRWVEGSESASRFMKAVSQTGR